MAPRKRSRQEPVPSSSPSDPTGIDETHAVMLARHLADLHKRRRFTDLKAHRPAHRLGPIFAATASDDLINLASIPTKRRQVRCGGEEFEMHASVVTCGSEYFRAMLEHAMVESGSGSFELHEVRPRVLERVVEWLYSGELGEISDVAEGLAVLEGSRFLGVARMEAQCPACLTKKVPNPL